MKPCSNRIWKKLEKRRYFIDYYAEIGVEEPKLDLEHMNISLNITKYALNGKPLRLDLWNTFPDDTIRVSVPEDATDAIRYRTSLEPEHLKAAARVNITDEFNKAVTDRKKKDKNITFKIVKYSCVFSPLL